MSYFRLDSRGQRWYADLSKYGGPSLKALIPDGERRATLDEDVARDLYTRWSKYYLDHKRRRHLGLSQHVTLADFARTYIEDRSVLLDGIKASTLEGYGDTLDKTLIPFFGANTPLGAIDTDRVGKFIKARRKQTSRKTGEPISWSTIQRDLCVLSSLFDRAVTKDLIFENAVRKHGWVEKDDREPLFLEPAEAWALLEAAAADRDREARPYLASFLYCGLRLTEGRGLEPCDIDREHKRVLVRDNQYRSYQDGGIKQRASLRELPLWPDLEEWLPARIGRGPLHPSPKNPTQPRSKTMRRLLARLCKAAGIEKHVTPHTLRHTWCAMRLQTLDQGAPVAPFTVMVEGGWTSLKMVERIYGHLPKQRLRLEVLTYRPEAARVRAAGE